MSNTSSLNKLAIEQMKREAKRIAKSKNISHAQALDQLAKPLGYGNWSMLMQYARKQGYTPNPLAPTPAPSSATIVSTTEPPLLSASTTEVGPVKELSPRNVKKNKPKPTKEPKPPKAPKIPKPRKPIWRSSATIGKDYALSGHMVRKVLLANGYIDVHGAATTKALDAEVVQIKMIESKYSDSTELVPFLLWSESLVEKLFDEPSELDAFCHITSRYQAETRICEAFARAGSALGVNFSGYDLKEAETLGLTEEEYSAFIEAHFNDPHFMGGPGAFTNARTAAQLTALHKSLFPLITSILKKLTDKNKAEAVFFGHATCTIYEWLLNQDVR